MYLSTAEFLLAPTNFTIGAEVGSEGFRGDQEDLHVLGLSQGYIPVGSKLSYQCLDDLRNLLITQSHYGSWDLSPPPPQVPLLIWHLSSPSVTRKIKTN